MFERTRIKYNEETGVQEVERYNPVKEKLKKAGEVGSDVLDFVGEYGWAIKLTLGTGLLIWAIGLNNGIKVTNKAMIDGWKDDGYLCRGDGLVFKKKMSFAEWMDYLDHLYNTKGGKKRKNINKYLKERGFID